MLSLRQIGTICFAFIFSIFSTNLFATGITANATSASCDNPTLGTYSGTSNLQANWQANEIDLFWYSDDTQITDVQSAATSCDYDNGLTVPSTIPTKTGYTFNGWKVRGLPDEYTRLQYIESTGTQYIDTGIAASNRAVFSMSATAENSETVKFIVSNIDSSSYTEGFGQYKDAVAGFNALSVTQKHFYDITYTGTYIRVKYDGVDKGQTNSYNIKTNKNIALFGSTSSQRRIKAKLYFLRLYNNDILVRDFIPAKNSSNVVGMYDTVSKTFFTNAGSGTFTAGPAVQ